MAEHDEIGPESVEAGLRAVFGDRPRAPQDSILDRVERETGERPSVLLRDGPEEVSPILKLAATAEAEARSDGRYQVLGEIARGGVGVVLKGRDKDLGRDVALKVLRKEYAARDDILERFVEEAQIGGQLQHPGIVPVYSIGLQADGRPFFAMKLVKGSTLSALLAERKSPADRRRHFLGIFEQVCQTIAYAHARGVVHRDLKPSNVMIGGFGEVQVVDWGFAKVLGSAPSVRTRPGQTIVATVRSGEGSSNSVAGSVLGTPAYMPPEQALGQVDDLDERADVFCLGGILCEILTGAPPYVGEPADLLTMAASARLDGAYARLDQSGAGPELVAFAKSCLAGDRASRPRDASAVARGIGDQLAAAEERARQTELKAAEARALAVEEQARLAEQQLAMKREEARAAEEERATAKERARQKEEASRAQWERKARVRTMAIAGALVLVALVTVGGYLKLAADGAERRRAAVARMNGALSEANERAGSQTWDEAIAAAKRAEEFAAGAGAEEVGRAREGRMLLEKRKEASDLSAERHRRDREFLGRLEELACQCADAWDMVAGDAAQAEAFRAFGCDVDALPLEESVRRLQESTDPVRLAAALDWWGITRMNLSAEGGRRLVQIAKGVDPDAGRNRIREAVLAEDRDTLLREAKTIDIAGTPVTSLTLLGRGLLGIDEVTALREFMHRVQRAHPEDLWANLWLGYAYASTAAADGAKAMPYFTAALALRPQNAGARLQLASCLSQYSLFDEALAHCDQVLAAQPRSVSAYCTRCQVCTAQRDFPRAEEALRKAFEIDPLAPWALGTAASLEFARGDPKAALDYSRKLFAVSASDRMTRSRIHGNMSAFHLLLFDLESAMAEARKALDLRPDQIAFANLGEALRQAGRIDEAVAALEQGRKHFPDSPVIELRLAILYMNAKDWPRALDHIRHVRELDKATGADLLSSWHLNRHEIPEAIRCAREAIRLMPKNLNAWNMLALAHARIGDYASAIAFLRNLGDLDNQYPILTRGNIAEIRIAQGEYDLALKELEGQLDHIAENSIFVWPLEAQGTALLWTERFAEALPVLRRGAALEASLPLAALDTVGQHRLRFLLRDAERVAPLAAHGGAIVRGEENPANAAEALAFAKLCFYGGENARAAGLFAEAFSADATLEADDYDRFDAACAAALAGASWAPRALGWLRACLLPWQRRVAAAEGNDRIDARWVLTEWRRARWLAPVRDTLALARMPGAERKEWLEFWGNVDALDAATRKEG